MSEPPYLDTSALTKWYINEPGADAFAAFITTQDLAAISRLTVVEFHCMLARRRRAGHIDTTTQQRIVERFESDITRGNLRVHPLEDHHAAEAAMLVRQFEPLALRALDALHLAIARNIGATALATADRVMADAGGRLGMEVVRFD